MSSGRPVDRCEFVVEDYMRSLPVLAKRGGRFSCMSTLKGRGVGS